jgi:hypothetical protein
MDSGRDATLSEPDADAAPSIAQDAASLIDAQPAAEAGSTCNSSGVEDCFNGADDDCNDLIDCADPACERGAVCEPAGDEQGVLVPADERCPEGYQAESLLYQGLTGEPCSGCACSSTATECSAASVYFYADERECGYDTEYTGGTYVGDVTGACTGSPLTYDTIGGFRVAPISVLPSTGSCTPVGSATPGAVQWTRAAKWCVAEGTGKGCQFGYACVPVPQSGTYCIESAECPKTMPAQEWFEDYVDERSCDACQCSGAGDCSGVQVRLGSDWVCDANNAPVGGGQKDCTQNPYSPPAELVGAPTDPICEASVDTVGELTAVGSHQLCCTR